MISKIEIKIVGGIMTSFVLFLLPVFLHAQTVTDKSFNTKEKTGITYECAQTGPDGKTVYGNCTFQDVLAATNKIVDFGRNFALVFSVVIIAIAGFRYMTSAGNPAKITEANNMFVSVLWGLFFVLAAWLIVHLITNALLKEPISFI